jgi:methionyl-tRNA formyltransferase
MTDPAVAPARPFAHPPAHPHRLAYLGTPEVGVPPLRALVDAGFEIAVVVSRPDKRRGRGGALSPSPVKAAAIELGLPVSDDLDAVLEAGIELGVVVAYGRLIPDRILEAVPMVNIHFSLLPRWRGAAPVERALLAGDAETGVCLMDVVTELDTGDVHASGRTAISPDDTLDSLRSRLVDIGSELLVDNLHAGLGTPTPQSGEVTYAAKIDPAELHIDWSASADSIDRLVRLGGAWTTFRGARLKVHGVAPATATATATGEPGTMHGLAVVGGDGALELVEVQPEGKGRQAANAWRNGARPVDGERLGT